MLGKYRNTGEGEKEKKNMDKKRLQCTKVSTLFLNREGYREHHIHRDCEVFKIQFSTAKYTLCYISLDCTLSYKPNNCLICYCQVQYSAVNCSVAGKEVHFCTVECSTVNYTTEQ